MTSDAPVSPFPFIALSEVVVAKEEPSNAVTASSDAAWCVAPKEATVAAPVDSESNTITCANVAGVVPTACTTTAHLEGPKCNVPCEFSQYVHRLVTAVSSDDSVVEAVVSSLTDNPEVQEKRAPSIVHRPSSGASKNTHATSDKKCDDISSDVKNARHGNTVVHDGIVSALDTSHDMPVENNDADAEADPSDAFAAVPVSTAGFAHVTNRSASGEVNTTAAEAVDPSRVMIVDPSPVDVGGNMGKNIQVASIVERFVEAEVDSEESLAKKRKFEVQSNKNDQLQLTSKKVKVPKDPNAPKKNLTAYMHYATYARDYIKSRHPQLKASDVTRNVRRGWDAMTAAERNYWNEKAAADKERYERELVVYKNSKLGKAWQARVDEENRTREANFNEYVSTFGVDSKSKEEKEAEISDTNAPKPSVSAYMHYDAYARSYIKERHPRATDAEVTKVVQRGWGDMNLVEHNYWNEKAAADFDRYQKELARFNASKQVDEQQPSDFESLELEGAIFSV